MASMNIVPYHMSPYGHPYQFDLHPSQFAHLATQEFQSVIIFLGIFIFFFYFFYFLLPHNAFVMGCQIRHRMQIRKYTGINQQQVFFLCVINLVLLIIIVLHASPNLTASTRTLLQICLYFQGAIAIYFTSSSNLSIIYFREREKNRNGIEISCIPLFLDPCNKLTLIATDS